MRIVAEQSEHDEIGIQAVETMSGIGIAVLWMDVSASSGGIQR